MTLFFVLYFIFVLVAIFILKLPGILKSEEVENMFDDEYGRVVCRSIPVTVKPTVTEIADIIWHLDADEQITLIGCLKRRFCSSEAGLMQMASAANTLKELPTEKADEVRTFVKCLADYILGENK